MSGMRSGFGLSIDMIVGQGLASFDSSSVLSMLGVKENSTGSLLLLSCFVNSTHTFFGSPKQGLR